MKNRVGNSLLIISLLFVALLQAGVALASVDPRRGNYHLEQSDGPADAAGPRLVRHYDSGRPFKGMFGPGWTTPYEIRLTAGPSGELVLFDLCLGEDVRFVPALPGVPAGTGTAASAQKSATASRSPALRDMPVGSAFQSARCGCQVITRTAIGFVRSVNNRDADFYDEDGRLVMTSGSEGEKVTVTYDKAGSISELRDDQGRSLVVSLNDHSQVVKVSGWKGADAVYRYDEKDELVEARTPSGGQRSYRYDDRHAMVSFQEGTDQPEVVAYSEGQQRFRVRSVVGSGGEIAAYSYHVDPLDPLSYGTLVAVRELGEAGEEHETTVSYEYRERAGEGDSTWLEREVVDNGYEKKETLYSETRSPLAITVDGARTGFTYDGKGRLLAKERANGDVTELEYEATANKISRVRGYNRNDPGKSSETVYRYDERGNLVFAKDAAGRSVTMTYDAGNKVATMVVGARSLGFAYGKFGKPVRIEVAGLGALVVTYDDAGEILTTVAEGLGVQISLAVTDAFSTMLELVSAAKVSVDER